MGRSRAHSLAHQVREALSCRPVLPVTEGPGWVQHAWEGTARRSKQATVPSCRSLYGVPRGPCTQVSVVGDTLHLRPPMTAESWYLSE